ncbi:MAG: ABC transporter ATP-binding protein [Micrococcales bacterium]|nr:ABC transporter ATP-binding protein [Micrococcales bacterium]
MSRLEFDAAVAPRSVEAQLTVADGETVALIGPNGAGKSTILGVVAGLVAPTSGTVRLGGRDLTTVPPHRRQTALLAQDPLLFPHMTALENVAFGPTARGVSRAAARSAARRWLHETGVGDLAEHKPHQLSGGQAQRVAVARALAAEPQLLLLDEPMAALDVAVTPALRQTLRTVLADQTAVIVTHDALDALLLADRVVVIDEGRVVETGPTADVLARPRSPFAARIAGLNFVTGQWDGDAVTTPSFVLAGKPPDPSLRVGAPAVAVFSPGAVRVDQSPASASTNTITATITDVEPLGDRVRLRTLAGTVPVVAEIRPTQAANLDLTLGSQVVCSVDETEVTIYDLPS